MYVNVQDKKQWTSLHYAAWFGYLQIAEFIIGWDDSFVDSKTNNNCTALHLAAYKGHFQIAKLLVQNDKVNISALTTTYRTALHIAAANGHLDIVKLLSEKSLEIVNKRTRENLSAIDLATFRGNLPIVQYLLDEKSASQKVLFLLAEAILMNHTNIVKFLFQNDIHDINDRVSFDRNSDGNKEFTLLDDATKNTDTYDDDIDILDDFYVLSSLDNLPVDVAARNGNVEMVKILVENERSNSKNALEIAVKRNDTELAEYLLKELEVNSKRQRLHFTAAFNGNLDLTKLLLDNEDVCDDNIDNREMILQIATWKGHFQIVKYLAEEKHASLKMKNYMDETLLYIAAKRNYLDIADYLLDSGKVEVNARNKNDRSAIEVIGIFVFEFISFIFFYIHLGYSFTGP